ncbi:hypothetical protein GCK72_002590 [Caenorhabditis remanei]|uniref:PLAT domain-containing protein n=1 Tax=Caenorhabditis remanei TaxID=31234 RepID=A0A6A5HWM6_CAERE|nr:hypothetical protein GCK72_002590 [Caenorhabditis remanei]KAF1770767.1 hypothetical protein GCK72_002590 [Caenorhabditis remanei]
MPTTPTLPARIKVAHVLQALQLISAKQVFFVLNGKGKFHRSLINPMKLPSMEMLLEECSTHLQVAIHRLYTPEGKLIMTVNDILSYDGPRIIACPRNERPHLDEKTNSSNMKLPEIHPNRYAPRQAYTRVVNSIASDTSTGGSAGVMTSGSSSGNSIEKRQRLPVLNTRYIPRKHRENGITSDVANNTTRVAYIAKSYSTKRTAPTTMNRNHIHSTTKEVNKKSKKDDDTAISSAASTAPKDSGTGTSINSQQSDRPESMTERKAQMIRDELRANLHHQHHNQSSSDQYSEEDMIREEESDYDNIGGGIHSGTDEEEDDRDSALGSGGQRRSVKSSHRTPTHRTPSTSGSEQNLSRKSTAGATDSRRRTRTISRQDTPYQATPSRQSTVISRQGTTESSEPKSIHSSRASTASKAIQEVSDEEEEEEEFSRETPAAQTPDTRLQTAKSRRSTAGSARSFASESSRAWSRISGYSDKEEILPSDEDDELPKREISTAERALLEEEAAKLKYEKEQEEREEDERLRREYVELFTEYSVEILLGERYGIDFDMPLFIVMHGEKGSSQKLYMAENDWLSSELQFYETMQWVVQKFTIPSLGMLKSIDVGHEQEGYGAGTFIERVVITENTDGQCFQFAVAKWFDSGQVDGLIERHIELKGHMTMMPIEENKERKVSQGRWEFHLHSLHSELGGTTSNLVVTGYGQLGSSAHEVTNKNLLQDPMASTCIQLDFGQDIGELRKVRFEIDGVGEKPNYYLEKVEATDLDRKQHCVIMVNRWLHTSPTPGFPNWQPFREIALLSTTHFHSSLKTFEGIIRLSDKSLMLYDNSIIYLQCFSREHDDEDIKGNASGIFPVIPVTREDGEIQYEYNVEFVTQRNDVEFRFIPKLSSFGKDVMDGFGLFKDIFRNMEADHLIDNEALIADELFVEEVIQFNGEHCPYYSVYRTPFISYEPNNPLGPYFKHLINPVFAAIETKQRLESENEGMVTWEVSMSLLEKQTRIPLIPTVVLVGKDDRTFEMECLMENPEHHGDLWYLKYSLTVPNFGNPTRCRISCEETNEKNYTFVHKMFLREKNSNTQVFIKPSIELFGYDTHEYECPYPDIGGWKNVEYMISIETLEGGGDFRPYVNIIGQKGKTGYRASAMKISEQGIAQVTFTSALSLLDLQSIEVWAKTGHPDNWRGIIEIKSDKKIYQSGELELTKNGQIALSPLTPIAELDDEENEYEQEEEDQEGSSEL